MTGKARGSKFKPGQVWSYHNRPGENQSHILVLDVEDKETDGQEKVLIHVYVGGLSIETPYGVIPAVPFLVFTKHALDKSVTKLIGRTRSRPDIRLGKFIWSTTTVRGKPIFYDTEVSHAIDLIEGTYGIMPMIYAID